MIKLSGQSLTPEAKFTPETMALNLMERASTAQITGGLARLSLQVGDWLLDDTEPGAGIVWRVKTMDSAYDGYTVTATLEHVINTLRDISMFGESKPADITGTAGATTCTAREAAQYVLSKQSIWALGDFEYTDSAAYSFNGDDLFAALEKITGTLEDPCWEYDLSSLPFKLHIRHKSTETACEMRMGRNISTLRRTIDRSQMYTRIYPIGKKNLHITGEYLSQNEAIWGRKDKVETDQSKETEDMLRLWALDRLRRHCEPTVTITIGGLELSRATGEALDHLVIGTICRVPLPDFGVTITERITKLAWKDKIKEPENVTATMCNNRQDIASIISEQISGGGGGARADAKEKEEDHAWFVDTSSHVAMVAEAIIGRDGETVDWSRVAEIIVDGSGIHQQVVAAHSSLVTAFFRLDANDESLTSIFQKTGVESLAAGDTLYSRITQTAESLTSEISRATAAEGSLSSRITQTAESITSEVSRATAAEGSLSSRIYQTESSIGLVVSNGSIKAAEIVAAINDSGSSVIISGDKIDINANQEYRQTILKKSAVYPQFTDPAQETGAGIQDGDVWVKTNSTRTWAEMGEASWVDSTEFNWQDYYGAETYIRKNGKWELIENQQQDYINGTQIRQNENEIALVAGNLEGYHAQFTVAADEIRGEVANTQGQLSVVSQKADEVSIEVANARGSEATLGARFAVTDQAITSKVSAGDIASTINQTAQSVLIQAQKIDLQGYVTASQLSAELADFETQWATSITTDWFRADLADIELLRINTALQINSQYAEWQSTTIGGVTLHYLGSAPT